MQEKIKGLLLKFSEDIEYSDERFGGVHVLNTSDPDSISILCGDNSFQIPISDIDSNKEDLLYIVENILIHDFKVYVFRNYMEWKTITSVLTYSQLKIFFDYFKRTRNSQQAIRFALLHK